MPYFRSARSAKTYTLTQAAKAFKNAGIMLVRKRGDGVLPVEPSEVEHLLADPWSVSAADCGVTVEELAAFRDAIGSARAPCCGLNRKSKRCRLSESHRYYLVPSEWVAAIKDPPIWYCLSHESQAQAARSQ